MAGLAVAIAVAVAASRVLLDVHWLTDVIAGLVLGWAWFAACAVAFGGRMLSFGATARAAESGAPAPRYAPAHAPPPGRRTGSPPRYCRAMSNARAEFQPELWVRDGRAAVAFYERALGAVVDDRVDGPGEADLIAQLRVAGARLRVSSASESMRRFSPT